ncbi:MAG: XRE family transcriptional regulator [Chloroflexota bacterium]
MTNKEQRDPVEAGQESYEQWREELHAGAEYTKLSAEEAAKSELWLQLVEARQAAGLTQAQMAERLGVSQAQVARIEKRGYDAYTLTTLRRYVAALGAGYTLEVHIHIPEEYMPPQDNAPHQHGLMAT